MSPSLAASSIESAQLLDKLSALLHDDECQSRSSLAQAKVEDQSARFQVWAGNLGAFQRLPAASSLDHRLRDSPKIATQIHELLTDLRDATRNAFDIAVGERPNRQYESEDDEVSEDEDDIDIDNDEDDEQQQNLVRVGEESEEQLRLSEAEELLESIKETIASLFRLAMVIRNASPRDRFAKALSVKGNPFDGSFDIAHVGHKHPRLDTDANHWLRDRLGTAITQRRQFLRYAREHRIRMSKEFNVTPTLVETVAPPVSFNLVVAELAPSNMGRTNTTKPISTLAPTAASTLLLVDIPPAEIDFRDDQSQTSYALSLGEDDEGRLQLPRLVDVSKGQTTFECPLCWTIQGFRKESAWRKHAFSDLRPYICTFDKCDMKLFSDRKDWFEHELTQHRTQWLCHFCSRIGFQNVSTFQEHLRRHQTQQITQQQLDALAEASRRPLDRIPAIHCPFCEDWETFLRQENPNIPLNEEIVVTPTQFRHHVGTHMQRLALFAVPRGHLVGDEGGEGGSDSGASACADAGKHASYKDNKSHHSTPSDSTVPYIPASILRDFDIAHCASIIRSSASKSSFEFEATLIEMLPALSTDELTSPFFEFDSTVMSYDRSLREMAELVCLGQWGCDAYWLHQWKNESWNGPECGIVSAHSLISRTLSEYGQIDRVLQQRYSSSIEDCIDIAYSGTSYPSWIRCTWKNMISYRNKISEDTFGFDTPINELITRYRRFFNSLHKDDKSREQIFSGLLTSSNRRIRKVVSRYWEIYPGDSFVGTLTAALADVSPGSQDSSYLYGYLKYCIEHIIDGATNSALRDAKYLHARIEHCVKRDSNSYMAMVPDLVRFHWDSAHLQLIKYEFEQMSGATIESMLRKCDRAGPSFSNFCIALMQPSTMPILPTVDSDNEALESENYTKELKEKIIALSYVVTCNTFRVWMLTNGQRSAYLDLTFSHHLNDDEASTSLLLPMFQIKRFCSQYGIDLVQIVHNYGPITLAGSDDATEQALDRGNGIPRKTLKMDKIGSHTARRLPMFAWNDDQCLPEHALVAIFSYCGDSRSVLNLRSVNKDFRGFVDFVLRADPSYWGPVVARILEVPTQLPTNRVEIKNIYTLSCIVILVQRWSRNKQRKRLNATSSLLSRRGYELFIKSPDLLTFLEPYFVLKNYSHGEVVVLEGSDSLWVGWVVEGQVSLLQDHHVFSSHRRYQVGLISAVQGEPQFFSVVSDGESCIAQVSKKTYISALQIYRFVSDFCVLGVDFQPLRKLLIDFLGTISEKTKLGIALRSCDSATGRLYTTRTIFELFSQDLIWARLQITTSYNPWYIAAQFGDVSLGKYLNEYFELFDFVFMEETALSVALQHKRREFVLWLRENGAKNWGPLDVDSEGFTYLLERVGLTREDLDLEGSTKRSDVAAIAMVVLNNSQEEDVRNASDKALSSENAGYIEENDISAKLGDSVEQPSAVGNIKPEGSTDVNKNPPNSASVSVLAENPSDAGIFNEESLPFTPQEFMSKMYQTCSQEERLSLGRVAGVTNMLGKLPNKALLDFILNNEDVGGVTPLIYAVEQNHVELAKVLIAYGANVNMESRYLQRFPLDQAILVSQQGQDSLEMLDILVRNGATYLQRQNLLALLRIREKVLTKQDYRWDVWLSAVFQTEEEHHSPSPGSTMGPSSSASMTRKAERAETTALDIAISEGNVQTVRSLLGHSTPLIASSDKALELAFQVWEVSGTGENVVKMLLENGYDESHIGDPAVRRRFVALKGKFRVPIGGIKLKLEKDAQLVRLEASASKTDQEQDRHERMRQPEVTDEEEEVEHITDFKGVIDQQPIIEDVIVSKPEGHNVEASLHTPLSLTRNDLAAKIEEMRVVEDAYHGIRVAAFKQMLEKFPTRELSEKSINLPYRHWERRMTLLTRAIELKNLDVIKLLIEYGADVNLRTDDGQCPLDCAMTIGPRQLSRFMVILLLNNGATAVSNDNAIGVVEIGESNRITSDYGQDWWSLVEASREDAVFKDTVFNILENSTRSHIIVNMRSESGLTALNIAIKNGDVGSVRLLLKHGAGLADATTMNPLEYALNAEIWNNAIIQALLDEGWNESHIRDSELRKQFDVIVWGGEVETWRGEKPELDEGAAVPEHAREDPEGGEKGRPELGEQTAAQSKASKESDDSQDW